VKAIIVGGKDKWVIREEQGGLGLTIVVAQLHSNVVWRNDGRSTTHP
jgi:hypothetical protein